MLIGHNFSPPGENSLAFISDYLAEVFFFLCGVVATFVVQSFMFPDTVSMSGICHALS